MSELKKEKKNREEFQLCFGNHLKKFRKSRGITGAELARRCYMDKPNLTRLEKGRVNPSLYIIKKLCDALETRLEDFMKEFKY